MGSAFITLPANGAGWVVGYAEAVELLQELNETGRTEAERIASLEKQNERLSQKLDELSQQVAALAPRKTPYIPRFANVHEEAAVHPTVNLQAAEDKPITIGARTLIARQTDVIGPVSIGSGCLINVGGFIRSNVTIGNNVLVGPFTRFMTDTHEQGGPEKRGMKPIWPPITVGDGTWIGSGVTILGNVNIGKGCIVAAGAVVTKDVPDNTLVGGVPAKVLRELEDSDSPLSTQGSLHMSARNLLDIATEYAARKEAIATRPEYFTEGEGEAELDAIAERFEAGLRELVAAQKR